MPTATWMVVGMMSLLDWPMFTWSFAWTGFLLPTGSPASCEQRLPMTSLTFMFVEVPLPV